MKQQDSQRKLDLVIEAIQDWKRGGLSGNAALMAISLVVFPQPPLTEATIKKAEELSKEWAKRHPEITE